METKAEVPKKNRAAVALGRLGGKSGRGPAKSRAAQVRQWWQSPAGQAERARRKPAALQVPDVTQPATAAQETPQAEQQPQPVTAD